MGKSALGGTKTLPADARRDRSGLLGRLGGRSLGRLAAELLGGRRGRDGRQQEVGVDRERQVFVYTVASSGTKCLPWPTGRGNLRRTGYVTFE